MLKLKKNFILLMVTLLLIVSQVIQPTSISYTYAFDENHKLNLFQAVEEIELSEGLIIKEDTYFYGNIDNEVVQVQYADTYISIPVNKVKEVWELENDIPYFHEFPIKSKIENITEETPLFSVLPNEKERIIIQSDVEYPISENDLGLKVLYFGNIEYYLSKEDREKVLKAIEDELIENSTQNNVNEVNSSTEEDEILIDKDTNTVEASDHESTPVKPQEIRVEIQSIKEDDEEIKENKETSEDYLSLWNKSPSKYFMVMRQDLEVYDNRTGKLVKIGKLKQGQIYPRVSDYGAWHRIQFGDIYGYVRKAHTAPIPEDKANISNINNKYKNGSRFFEALDDVVIYDNSSGSLVPFGVIDKGQNYPIASDYGNWWRVIFSDRIGYVSKKQVDVQFTKSDKYFKTLRDLPIYDNRTGKLVKVGELPSGQVYPRVSDYGNWHRIQFGDIYGYVHKPGTTLATGNEIKNLNTNFKHQSRTFTALEKVTVYENTSGNLIPFGTIDKGKTFPIVSDYGSNWWRIVYVDRVGYVNKGEVRVEVESSDKYFRAIRDTSVYDNRTGSLVKVGELKKGQAYPIVSNYGNWWRVQFGNIYGYVRKSDTGYATANEFNNLNTSYKNTKNNFVTKQKVTVYDNTSGKLVPFGQLEENQLYPIASDYGNWWRIIYLDRVGYVRKSEVELSVSNSYKNYNISLEEAVKMQLKTNPPPQTDKYRNSPAYIMSSNIEKLEAGSISGNGVRLRSSPRITSNNIKYTVNSGTTFVILNKNVLGDEVSQSKIWYEIEYNGEKLYVHSSLARINSNLYRTKVNTNVYADTKTSSHIYGTLSKGTWLNVVKEGSSWYEIKYNTWRNASSNDVKYYLDPNNFINDHKQMFQFLDLSKPSGATVAQLNKFLEGKGVLKGQGQSFIEAANQYGINDVYLLAHSLLETGNGSSQLAKGVEVGKDKSGKPVLVTSSNRSSLTNIKTVYNVYGIGAYDSCALSCGAIKAYESEWTSIPKAITGGAAFISEGYILGKNSRNTVQNTIYKMRWNPEAMDRLNQAWHQYATDIGWASKQINNIYNLYQEIGIETYYLEIPVYKK